MGDIPNYDPLLVCMFVYTGMDELTMVAASPSAPVGTHLHLVPKCPFGVVDTEMSSGIVCPWEQTEAIFRPNHHHGEEPDLC